MVNSKKKIAVVTGTRAEYGLLSGLMHEIKNDPDFDLQVIATCMHLSPEFGLTHRLIESDGFHIDAYVEMLLSSDSGVGVGKSMGLGVISFTDTFHRLQPDLIIVLGDRFETLAVAQAALVLKIPVAHIHGGELSEGALDDAIRHAITKLSHLHFVAAEPYRKRIIQMGENPKSVFNYGAPGLERIRKTKLLTRKELSQTTKIKLTDQCNFLITYLPATLEQTGNAEAIQALFSALDEFPEANLIFTKANADEAGRFINSKVEQYVFKNSSRAAAYTTLGDLNYLSLLQFVDVVIGNSSSGLIEVPHYQKPTVNIGHRQTKRLRAPSVIDCSNDKNAIVSAIKKALSPEFKLITQNSVSPYTQDDTARKIVDQIKQTDLKQILLKTFHDVVL